MPLEDSLATQGELFINLKTLASIFFTKEGLGNFSPSDFPEIRFVANQDTLQISLNSEPDEIGRKVIYNRTGSSTSAAIYEIHPNELIKAAQDRSSDAVDVEGSAHRYGLSLDRLSSIILIDQMATIAIEIYLIESGISVTQELICEALDFVNNS